jgi:hypothetical protein
MSRELRIIVHPEFPRSPEELRLPVRRFTLTLKLTAGSGRTGCVAVV